MLLKNGATHLRNNGDVRFYLSARALEREEDIICLNVLEDIKQFYLLMWYKKTRLETPIT